MTQLEGPERQLVPLPKAAEEVGIHRATLNDMVLANTVTGHRLGAHWFIERADLEELKRTYTRPRNSPRRRKGEAVLEWRVRILELLDEWDEATASDLQKVLQLSLGNIRKYLAHLEIDGLATRNEYGDWSIAQAGRQALRADAKLMLFENRSVGASRDDLDEIAEVGQAMSGA